MSDHAVAAASGTGGAGTRLSGGASVHPSFLSQAGRVGQLLAIELLRFDVGDQVPTIAELSHRHGVGGGTVQKALELLKEAGCVELRSRGHLGTYIRAIDRVALWRTAGADAVVGSMPLPYSRRYEGLATALRAAWPTSQLELLLTFTRGSQQRLQTLAYNRVDFVVLSRYAAQQAVDAGAPVEIAVELPELTYAKGHELLFSPGKDPRIRDRYRVGIDSTSTDQIALTHLECDGMSVELVEVGYMQLAEALTTGSIDVAVWAADELLAPTPAITRVPLQSPAARDMDGTTTSAVIVTNAIGPSARDLVRSLLDVDELLATQQRVLRGEQLPSY